MPTTHADISYTSTTHIDALPGFGIMCDNVDHNCDCEHYYCDGAVVSLDVRGGQGLRCNDTVIKCNNQIFDCQGAVMHAKESY